MLYSGNLISEVNCIRKVSDSRCHSFCACLLEFKFWIRHLRRSSPKAGIVKISTAFVREVPSEAILESCIVEKNPSFA